MLLRPHFTFPPRPTPEHNYAYLGGMKMPWRIICRAIVALFLLPVMSSAQSSWEEKNRLGEKAFQEGRLADANRLFTDALQQARQFGPNLSLIHI